MLDICSIQFRYIGDICSVFRRQSFDTLFTILAIQWGQNFDMWAMNVLYNQDRCAILGRYKFDTQAIYVLYIVDRTPINCSTYWLQSGDRISIKLRQNCDRSIIKLRQVCDICSLEFRYICDIGSVICRQNFDKFGVHTRYILDEFSVYFGRKQCYTRMLDHCQTTSVRPLLDHQRQTTCQTTCQTIAV